MLVISPNILIDSCGNGRIVDFGLYIEFLRHEAGRSLFTSKFLARSGYYASEVTSEKYLDKIVMTLYSTMEL